MRKSYIATWVLLTCSVLATLVFSIATFASRNDVLLKETVVYGDSSRADGLTLKLLSSYNRDYFWDTSYTFGNPDISQTDFHLYTTLPDTYKDFPRNFNGFDLTIDSDSLELFEKKYYTLHASFDFPSTVTDRWEDFLDSAREQSVALTQLARLQHYFKIPVVKENGDDFYWNTTSALSEDMCYFTFDLHTKKENLVDYSLLPDGFGIFAFPNEKGYLDENGDHVLGCNTAKLKMVYPLDPDTHIKSLNIDNSKQHLLLFTTENNKSFLTVIDIRTMKEIQKLELFTEGEFMTWILENAIVLLNFDSKEIAVISYESNQSYKLDFTCPLQDEFRKSRFGYPESVCYDGKRLAFSSSSPAYIHDTGYTYATDICITIYENTGLSYFGTYRNSLFSGREMDISQVDSYNCDYNEFPIIYW